MVVKTFALVKKMSDGRQKRKRSRTTLIKSKAALLPPSVSTLIKENTLYSTGNGCGLFPESRKQSQKKSSNRTATARRS